MLIGAVAGALLGVLVGGLIGGIGSTQGLSPKIINKTAEAATEYKVERNGESTAFSAYEAMLGENGEEEIKKFLKDSGLEEGTKEFNDMLTYITSNAKEFDEHAQNISEDNAAIKDHIKALGESAAAARSMDKDTATGYASIIAALADNGEYQRQVEFHRAKIKQETGITEDATTNEFKAEWLGLYEEYAKIMGLTLNTLDTKNLLGEGVELPTHAELL
jgi:hypothetical protein